MINQGIIQQGQNVWYGLTHYWGLHESSGSVAYDYVGDLDATVSNYSIQTSGGINGNCLKGTANNASVKVTSDGYDDFNNQRCTINLWMYVPSTQTQSNYYWAYDYTSHSDPYYALHARGRLAPWSASNHNGSSYAAVAVDDAPTGEEDEWHMATMVLNDCTIHSYVNGQLYSTSTVYDGQSTYYYHTGFYIGFSQNIYNVRTDWGNNGISISDAMYWERPLSPSEVEKLYNNGSGTFYIDEPPVTANLVSRYAEYVNNGKDRRKLSTGTEITQWDDMTGHGLDFTLSAGSNPTLGSDDALVWTSNFNSFTGGTVTMSLGQFTIFIVAMSKRYTDHAKTFYRGLVGTEQMSIIKEQDPTIGTSTHNYDKTSQKDNTSTPQWPGDVFNVITQRCNGTHASHIIRKNGSTMPLVDADYTNDPGTTTASVSFEIGSYYSSRQEYKEVLIYKTSLSDTDMQAVENYLMNKYGI